MDKRSSKKKEHDFAVTAFRVVQEATGEESEAQTTTQETLKEPSPEERHAAAVMLGRIGGTKGGKARAAKLTPEERREIAKKAAMVRWQKNPP
ncbi:MAG: hypothetical protein HYU86_00855 [Chloroflexi bacterium]|nr:hypothetical protein [Chloroflexota bacterium]